MFIILFVLSAIIPVAGIFFDIFYFKSYQKPVLAALLCGVAFSAAFYGYIPDTGNDIYRHMENLSLYQNIPLNDCFDLLSDYHVTAVYSWDIYLWGIAQLGNPYLLQSGAAFLGYSLISFMIFDQAQINKIHLKNLAPLYLMAIVSFPFLEITVGVRSANAFILSVLAFYFFYIKHDYKFIAILLFIIAVFLHHGVVIPLLAWLFLPVFNRFKKLSLFFLLAILFGFYRYQNYFYEFLGTGAYSSDLVENTLYSASTYSQSDFNDSFHALVSIVWRFGYSLILIFVASKSIRYSDNQQQKNVNKKTLDFTIMMLILSFGLLLILGNNGLRYIGIINLLCCVLLANNKFYFFGDFLWQINLKSLVLLMGGLGCCALYLYDMSWGTGLLKSFMLSSITGYISRIF